MWNEPMEEELKKLPGLYATENVPAEEKVVWMHVFIGGCDWYAAEYDPEDKVFFGFVIPHDASRRRSDTWRSRANVTSRGRNGRTPITWRLIQLFGKAFKQGKRRA